MKWYALFVEIGYEEYIQNFLYRHFDQNQLTSMAPVRKLPEKRKGRISHIYRKMFPGYVLIRTNMTAELFYQLKRVPRVHRLLTSYHYYTHEQDSYFSSIPEDEMHMVLQLTKNGNCIDFSSIYVDGSKVTVKTGPLVGKEGIIKKVDKRKQRAKIRIDFMNTTHTMDVGINVIPSSFPKYPFDSQKKLSHNS
ncbi:transcriptional antiterminator NusG [Thermoactinomyces sp. DSM 45891]|uniref:antiterminator LoaP n=1 Tax=Thermoactinomyces sp. DSM 45891 TaxID=1761907 RepID=UPI0009196F89|nr:antiterminator LoaP [Thermoactinomyces sp. DSM 45891]SFX26066.1 transcriptional antiterminator NusG [Thermoactinomyces sp. DSM 45891]